MLCIVPVDREEAIEFVRVHHRTHVPPVACKFQLGCATVLRGSDFGHGPLEVADICGVIIVGRPVARMNQDGWTLEVTRCCTNGTKNAPSKLYAAAWRATRAMGYRRLITYTMVSEPGTSLRAAGWKEIGRVKGRSWHTATRPRVDKHPLQDKICWEAG